MTPVNDAPIAHDQALATDEDTAAGIPLSGTDVDGDPLTFEIVTAPSHGTLGRSGGSITYTPAANFHGPDSFTFRVSDGIATSSAAAVSVTVASVNDAPFAAGGFLDVSEDGSAEIDLVASDADGDPLSFTAVTPPEHGTLQGSGGHLTYTPAPDYAGPDAFTFRASDGLLDSLPAAVIIAVAAVSDAPRVQDLSVATDEDTSVEVLLAGSDVDGDALVWSVVTLPAHGTLTGTGATLAYSPATDFHGADSFTYVASDGALASTIATVSLVVAPVNDVPIATGQSLEVGEGGSVTLTLAATDGDSDDLTYAVVSPPAHGTLSGTGPTLTYVPAPGFHGADSLVFLASDGTASSATATVTIAVVAAPDQPRGGCGCTTGRDAAPLGALLVALVSVRSGSRRRRPVERT